MECKNFDIPHGCVLLLLLFVLPYEFTIAQEKSVSLAYPLFDMLRKHAAPLLLVDPESGTILDANESAVKLYGYEYAMLKKMNITMLNILCEEEIISEMQRAVAEQRNYFNFPHRFADGSVHIMEVYSSPIKNPQGEVFLLSFVKEKELTATKEIELQRYAERVTDELALRVELYNAVNVRQKIIIVMLTLCIFLFIVAVINFVKYKNLAVQYAHNEQQYKNLLMSMQEGYSYHEMIFAKDGKPLDFIYLETNKAFETMTGLKSEAVKGKKVTEIIQGLDYSWIERYGNVAKNGEPLNFEEYEPNLNRWYRVSAFCPEPGKFAIIFLDISETKALIQKLTDALEEKDVLYRELLHRIKNTLITITSLISLQRSGSNVPDTCKPIIDHIHNQVKAYANLYNLMHKSDNIQFVDGGKYFTEIVETIVHGFIESDFNVSFSCAIEPVLLNFRTASSLGLIVNELVTNIFKHAFKGKDQAKLSVLGTRVDAVYALKIIDDGCGLPKGFSLNSSNSFGMLMVQQLVSQCNGTVKFEKAIDFGFSNDPANPGTCITIEFPFTNS